MSIEKLANDVLDELKKKYPAFLIESHFQYEFAGVLKMYGEEEGVYNGFDPVLETNIFSMQNEQDYYLHIDDAFGQEDSSAELFIDLRKAKPFES